MNRRSFLAAVPAGAAMAQAQPGLIKPQVLRPGDTVGLVTPSTYVSDPDRLWLAQKTVEALGLRCKMGRFVGRREGYLGGTIRERVEDLHAMFADPEVKGVFCVRGGYGTAMLLDSLDYGLIRKNPKVFLGCSDIMALHLGIHRMTGLATFHGPVVLSGLSDWTLEHFRRALFETKLLGRLSNPPEPRPIRPRHPWRAVRPGKARGPLLVIWDRLSAHRSALARLSAEVSRGRIVVEFLPPCAPGWNPAEYLRSTSLPTPHRRNSVKWGRSRA